MSYYNTRKRRAKGRVIALPGLPSTALCTSTIILLLLAVWCERSSGQVVSVELHTSSTALVQPNELQWTKLLAYWNRTLQRHVKPKRHKHDVPLTLVDYSGIAKDQDFANFINAIANVDTNRLSKNETYAFWLNVYNALVVKAIIANRCQMDLFGECGGCISSIRDIGTFLQPVWDQDVAVVGGRWHSLKSVEHILRHPAPYIQDPRLHGSVVKGCVSAPDLPDHAFLPNTIDAQLDLYMRTFLSNAHKGLRLCTKNKTITVSRVFDWYASDFENASLRAGGSGTVLDYILRFLNLADSGTESQMRLEYFDFDWDLNVVESRSGSPSLPRASKCKTRPCYWLWTVFVTLVGGAFMVLVLVGVGFYKFWKDRTERKYKSLQQAQSTASSIGTTRSAPAARQQQQ
eukprot:TRINITY_DN3357_c0_g1_i2.p1 TRINITY_DN3357_c0_g1~~TRINITY_DN3357_c0_g1_i2.p1  ORF type:complete len:403 (-),score=35.73 TRINITY_DN3357_c0_g1_i2:315-1523(-)